MAYEAFRKKIRGIAEIQFTAMKVEPGPGPFEAWVTLDIEFKGPAGAMGIREFLADQMVSVLIHTGKDADGRQTVTPISFAVRQIQRRTPRSWRLLLAVAFTEDRQHRERLESLIEIAAWKLLGEKADGQADADLILRVGSRLWTKYAVGICLHEPGRPPTDDPTRCDAVVLANPEWKGDSVEVLRDHGIVLDGPVHRALEADPESVARDVDRLDFDAAFCG